MTYVIGVDVGGTNTDVAILDGQNVIGWSKVQTTSNIIDGVLASITQAFVKTEQNGYKNIRQNIQRVSIGTTHFINAVIKRKGLSKVACIRLCGMTSQSILPFTDFPVDLREEVEGGIHLTSGGFQYDGRVIVELDEQELIETIKNIRNAGIRHIAVCGIFAPVDNSQERFVKSLITAHAPELTCTLSHDLGYLGLLERENATILNESLKELCLKTISGFKRALQTEGLNCPVFFTQNDGTLISEQKTLEFPVYTFSSGATNSMRGAVHLSSLKDAIVVDIGGTSTDVGVLVNGFPREASTRVKVAGVNTNFRMPDTKSIGVGGGSFVVENSDKSVTVGPGSVEYRLHDEALIFGGNTMVTSDVAVAAGYTQLGDVALVSHLSRSFVDKTMQTIKEMVEEAVDSVKLSKESYPVVLVGGGSVLIDVEKQFKGASKIIKPPFYQIANAVGAGLSQVSGTYDQLIEIKTDEQSRLEAIETAKQLAIDEAVRNGAVRETCSILDVTELNMSYVTLPLKRLKVKAVGNLLATANSSTLVQRDGCLSDRDDITVSSKTIIEDVKPEATHVEEVPDVLKPSKPSFNIFDYTPTVNAQGEWLLSTFDVECLTLGAGVLGCGGGGSPYLGRLDLLNCMNEGFQPRIIHPKSFTKGLAYGTAYMGAPEILYERPPTTKDLPTALHVLHQLIDLGFKPERSREELKDIASKNNLVIANPEDKLIVIDYKDNSTQTKADAILVLEIGGMNSLGPLTVGAQLDIPVIDCDGMGRAFPQLQHFAPFIYGCPAYPAVLVDYHGNTTCCLHAGSSTELEKFFRMEVVKAGCGSAISMSCFRPEDVHTKMCHNTLTQAWQIGLCIFKAREKHSNVVEAILRQSNGVCVVAGKIFDLEKNTRDGFTKGKIFIEGTSGDVFTVDFQNEYLIVHCRLSAASNRLLASTPDLITLVDTDTGEPIQSSELKYGIRVSVLVLPAHPVMKSERALNFVGPKAFGYEDLQYTSVGTYRDVLSNAIPNCE